MFKLTTTFVNDQNSDITGYPHILVNLSDITFDKTTRFLTKKHMLQRENIVLKFSQYENLDELFENDTTRTEFEEFVFSLLESKITSNRYIYLSFKIKCKDNDKLIHNGFYEWIEYWLLFFKFTHVNFLFELSEKDFSLNKCPIEYDIAKRMDNPRLSLSLNLNSQLSDNIFIPEDMTAYIVMFYETEFVDKQNFPYAQFYVQK